MNKIKEKSYVICEIGIKYGVFGIPRGDYISSFHAGGSVYNATESFSKAKKYKSKKFAEMLACELMEDFNVGCGYGMRIRLEVLSSSVAKTLYWSRY